MRSQSSPVDIPEVSSCFRSPTRCGWNETLDTSIRFFADNLGETENITPVTMRQSARSVFAQLGIVVHGAESLRAVVMIDSRHICMCLSQTQGDLLETRLSSITLNDNHHVL